MNLEYRLNKFSALMKIGIYQYHEGKWISYQKNSDSSPVFANSELRDGLMKGAGRQRSPYILKDDFQIYAVCIRTGAVFYFAGPVSLKTLSRVELHQYYKKYGMTEQQEKQLRVLGYSEFLTFVQLLDHLIRGTEAAEEEIVSENSLTESPSKRETEERTHTLFEMKRDAEMAYHHTYQEERKLLDCVREGRVEDAVRYTKSMDADLGKMSEKEHNHWLHTAIVGITLCTRAAIEGGVAPAAAYQLSDYYIQKCDTCRDIESLIRARNAGVQRFAEEVRKGLQKQYTSNYVEQCKDYVRKHYREKIYLADIAEELGISPNYLSRLFKKDTGIRLQDYVTEIRLEKAMNLLTYSSEPISRIAEYVNFPSQSYFGKILKKTKGMSPRQYREVHKPKEFLAVGE